MEQPEKMEHITFSIIVSIYNVEKFLEKCIDSVLNQTFTNYELILVDDGSPDSSGMICDEYEKKDKRIFVIHQKNSGRVAARLVGAEVAKGDYIVCLDGDDWLQSTYLEHFANIVSNYSPDVIVGGITEIFDDGREKQEPVNVRCRYGYYNRTAIQSDVFPELLVSKGGAEGFFPPVTGKAIRRNLFVEAIKLVDRKIFIGEDQCISKVCIARAESLYISEKSWYMYVQHNESCIHQKKARSTEYPMWIARHFEQTLDMSIFQQQVYNRCVLDLFCACITQFYGEKPAKSKQIIKKGLQNPYYRNAIKYSKFPFMSSGFFRKMIVKHRLYFLMRLYIRLHP